MHKHQFYTEVIELLKKEQLSKQKFGLLKNKLSKKYNLKHLKRGSNSDFGSMLNYLD